MSKKQRKPKTVSEQICDAIETAAVTRYRIAQDTGIAESALSRFINGTRGLSMESIDILAEYFGMELTPKRK